ncbi:MAG: hypothetical protein LH702_21935 [Phormidesmis sp. CAN_BIN44]|nr:hypothetical protein [Phormidesmis sp. CAN_BIN44]
MKFTPTKFSLLGLAIASALFSTSAMAQDFGLPPILLQQSSSFRNSDSQIVIRVGDFTDRDSACGSGFNGSRLGSDGFEFPHPGGDRFPRSRRSNNFDFPRPGGSSLTSFQLPNGSKNPDIIGCIDTQRNILFINIIRPQIKEQSPPPIQNPSLQTVPPIRPLPNPPVLQPPLPSPLNQTPIYNPSRPAGFPSS